MENQNNTQAVLQALGYPTLALPQTVEPVTKNTVQVQRVQYDPEKLKKLLEALGKKTESKSKYESLANALAQIEEPRSYKGGFGEEIINPWAMGASALARGLGAVYGDRLASERETALKDRENELKAAQLALEADKKAITETVADDYIKYNLNPNIKNEQAQAAADQKLAQTAYVKLNPKLGDEIRKNKDAFGYAAREADIGGRTPAGGTTGMGERLVASVAKGYVGDNATTTRANLLQQATQYVNAITDMAKQGGATGAMMNSDKEGQRAMYMFANPAAYSAEELAAGADVLVDLYDRMLAVRGMPSVEEGYNQVSQMVEARKPQTIPEQPVDPWAKYRTK